MRRFGLIGFPLTHSFSQKFFTEKFAQLGVKDCVYENYPIQDISELDAILKKPDLCGLNVTIPYKRQVIPFLNQASYAVNDIGACNCIEIKDGTLTGHNTDVFGFEKSLLPFLHAHHSKALVLGTGGASAAVVFVLNRLHIEPQYVSRNAAEGALGYGDLTEEVMNEHLLVINTTPQGMYPDTDSFPEIPYQYLTARHHLYDLVYNPAETKFLAKGKVQGATVQNGMEMLELQAEESWRIWNS
ncbi:MAG: shikimate dehydrogenase [Chitinophagaceae bacterium]|nr:shikimate dehydrogenase [Chitinophagaceae bacterium]